MTNIYHIISSHPMNIEYILPLVTFWRTISTQIMKYHPPNIANNAVSFIHCLTFIAHYNYDYNLNYATHISIGFYAYDLLFIFSRLYQKPIKDELKQRAPFIMHHIAGICLLNATLTGESNEQQILGGYIILEKSNIMLYISYYLHKQYTEYYKLNVLSDFIQIIVYSYYRVFALSLFLYNNKTHFFQLHLMTQILIMVIYSMGFAWSYRLLKKNIANIYAVRSLTRSKKYSSDG
jgi:hypothetical protein